MNSLEAEWGIHFRKPWKEKDSERRVEKRNRNTSHVSMVCGKIMCGTKKVVYFLLLRMLLPYKVQYFVWPGREDYC